MAGILSCFIIEYVGDRIIQTRAGKSEQTSDDHGDTVSIHGTGHTESGDANSEDGQRAVKGQHVDQHVGGLSHGAELVGMNDHVAVIVMEAGIIFHSVCEFPLLPTNLKGPDN